ncbi:phage head morphogenesis protein, partial [Helicobacter suis]
MPYLESIAALMARKPTLIKDPANFKFEDHLRVFALSKVGSIDTTIDVQNAIEKAIANKQTLHEFLKANPSLIENLGKKRLSRIFEYNKIYSHTRAKMLQFENTPGDPNSENGDGWYYIFESMHDSAARHLAFDQVCLPRKDPYWNTHTPPLDWGCRCQLHMVSKRGLKAFNESRGTNIEILEKAPSNLPVVDSKIAFEPNTYKYLQNFFKAKLESYAGNNMAKEKLVGVLKAIEDKKRRFKELVGLTKEVNRVMDFATLSPEITKIVGASSSVVKLQGAQMVSHLQKHAHTDLFDYYLVQDILEQPALIAKDPVFKNNIVIGVKFGRWYKIVLKILKLFGR